MPRQYKFTKKQKKAYAAKQLRLSHFKMHRDAMALRDFHAGVRKIKRQRLRSSYIVM